MEKIIPGVRLPDGRTYYPTGLEWLVAFAMAGCQWAIEALERYESEQGERWSGSGI